MYGYDYEWLGAFFLSHVDIEWRRPAVFESTRVVRGAVR
jgi:hypothetical protein